ncbi:hypothetical protein LMG28138_05496 [Pararobbsia alpina]|uniref:Uncharacterized protein n=1 Tax=Pararobbsia alpina TaxID=621374 RepID=A0A6S7CAC0_9BURK|nr:hypothetical protein LMG28138_05496 [Pararobbsia alpina]
MRNDHGPYEVTDPFVKQARNDPLSFQASDTPSLPACPNPSSRVSFLKPLYPRAQFNLPCPRAAMLTMNMEVFLGYGVRV